MIYPDNFEQKIGFNEIRNMLRERCLSTLGKEQVEKMAFSDDAEQVNEWLKQVREFRRLILEVEDFPLQYFYDVRESIVRIRIENTHLEENELFDLRRSLSTIDCIVKILNHSDEDESHAEENDGWRREKKYTYPSLHLLAKDIVTFPQIVQRIDQILDKLARYVTTLHPNCSRFAVNSPRPRVASPVPYIVYCAQHRARAWWRKTSPLPCAMADSSSLSSLP